MSLNTRRRWVAGMILGLGSASHSAAQEIPPAVPPLPGEPFGSSAPAPAPIFIARPLPPIVEVPPEGVRPIWYPGPLDPIALQRHQAPHVEHKARSWKWRRTQGKFWGYPEEFEPRTLGASSYEANKIMVANGASARLVLYNYDFLPGTAELSPRGIDQLARFVPQLAASPYPLLVERTMPDLALSESRRYAVLARLARGPYPVTSDRVLVGEPIPHGMPGIDAYIIANNSIQRTQQYGPPIPINSSGVNSPSGVTSGGGGLGGIIP